MIGILKGLQTMQQVVDERRCDCVINQKDFRFGMCNGDRSCRNLLCKQECFINVQALKLAFFKSTWIAVEIFFKAMAS